MKFASPSAQVSITISLSEPYRRPPSHCARLGACPEDGLCPIDGEDKWKEPGKLDVKATVFINVYVYRTKSHGVSNANPPPCRPSSDLSSHLCGLLRPPDRSLFCLYRNVVVKDPAVAGANREDAQQETSTGREDEHLCVTIALGRWPDPASPISPDFTIIKDGCIRRRPDLSQTAKTNLKHLLVKDFQLHTRLVHVKVARQSFHNKPLQEDHSRATLIVKLCVKSKLNSRVSDFHLLTYS